MFNSGICGISIATGDPRLATPIVGIVMADHDPLCLKCQKFQWAWQFIEETQLPTLDLPWQSTAR